MITLLCGLALGADLRFSASVEQEVADPFIARRGGRVGAEALMMGWVGGGVAVGGYPDLGEGDYTLLTESLAEEGILPSASRLLAQGAAYALVEPVRGRFGKLESSLGLVAGVSAVYTVDDLEAIGEVGEPEYMATEREVHPAALLGLRGEIAGESIGVRARVERLAYSESFGSETMQRRTGVWVGLDLVVHLDVGARRR
jgi:hypothetical protein